MKRNVQDEQSAAFPDVDEPLEGNYFVSTYPPFSVWSKKHVAEVKNRLKRSPEMLEPLGLYVHVPFCVKRCDYCYYLSYAQRSAEDIETYMDAVLRELTLYRQSAAWAERDLSFVYFGGGTPSMLNERTLAKTMERMQAVAGWSRAREVTFECAPKTVDKGKLRILHDSGVTRISLGVQTMHDDILKSNGRIHLSGDVERAYGDIRERGFPVVNIDLIIGLVGDRDDTFFESLDRIMEMRPESVTIYQLEIPHNTPLFSALQNGVVVDTLASWNQKRRRLGEAFARLEANGYHVRSAYSAIRDPERHRFIYQDAQYHGADLIGLGAASFSYLAGTHFQNVASDSDYVERLRRDSLPIMRAHALSDEERLIREFVLQLKLGEIDVDHLTEKFDMDILEHFADPLDELDRRGLIERSHHHLRLTRDGLLRVDRLLSMFYRAEHRNVRYS